jgi:hypothetical protein
MLTIARLSQYQLADEAHVRADYYKEQLRLLQALPRIVRPLVFQI